MRVQVEQYDGSLRVRNQELQERKSEDLQLKQRQ